MDILACPISRQLLRPISGTQVSTLDGENTYQSIDGIWRFLSPSQASHFQQFISEYETIRKEEGRGESDKSYYRALPYKDISGKRTADWRIRAASLNTLLQQVIEPLEQKRQSRVILDLGAGNGWLSYQLAKRGHALGAIDLLVNDWDGLGTYRHYDCEYSPLQADFNHLPIRDHQVDLVIYNASLHYSENYQTTLSEALRCLRADGKIVVMDTPIYRDRKSGEKMVVEREHAFRNLHGFASDALSSENFITFERMEFLSHALGIRWTRFKPDYGLRWYLRPIKARMQGLREPANFELILGDLIR